MFVERPAMFDENTFAAREEEPALAGDPVLAILAERERLCDLAGETLVTAEATDCATLLREADLLYAQVDALDEQIWGTQATSVAGILGQLERVKEAVQLQEDCEDLVDTIIAGIKQLIAANSSD
jgi:hypothetical protein